MEDKGRNLMKLFRYFRSSDKEFSYIAPATSDMWNERDDSIECDRCPAITQNFTPEFYTNLDPNVAGPELSVTAKSCADTLLYTFNRSGGRAYAYAHRCPLRPNWSTKT